MTENLLTVEQAAEHLRLHPKTVLRYIRDGRLPATRVGKSWRIARSKLDAFAGVADAKSEVAVNARATCIVDIPGIAVEAAERTATFLQAVAMARPPGSPPLHLQTAFDLLAGNLKIVVVGDPADVASVLEMLHERREARS